MQDFHIQSIEVQAPEINPTIKLVIFMVKSEETNDCSYLGFIDNETAIFINEKNYKKKLKIF